MLKVIVTVVGAPVIVIVVVDVVVEVVTSLFVRVDTDVVAFATMEE